MSLHSDVVRVLTGYGDQPELREVFLDHLAAHPDGMERRCTAGHVTGSALVIDPSRGCVLLTLHTKLDRWLQMGGHCEPGDATIATTALREATEESGVEGLTLVPGGPVRLDRHPIPSPCHWHLDVQYAAVAPAGAETAISDESQDLRWFPYDEVVAVADSSVVRLTQATLARLRTHP